MPAKCRKCRKPVQAEDASSTGDISYSQWAALLENVSKQDPQQIAEAKTTTEFAVALEISESRALRWLRKGCRAGWVQCVVVSRKGIDGVARPAPGYIVRGKEQ